MHSARNSHSDGFSILLGEVADTSPGNSAKCLILMFRYAASQVAVDSFVPLILSNFSFPSICLISSCSNSSQSLVIIMFFSIGCNISDASLHLRQGVFSFWVGANSGCVTCFVSSFRDTVGKWSFCVGYSWGFPSSSGIGSNLQGPPCLLPAGGGWLRNSIAGIEGLFII